LSQRCSDDNSIKYSNWPTNIISFWAADVITNDATLFTTNFTSFKTAFIATYNGAFRATILTAFSRSNISTYWTTYM
jgi:ABC-type phosphate/phosphonate transport system permease subunit